MLFPIGVELIRYDDGRTVVEAGGRQFGPPRYEHEVAMLTRHRVFNDGAPISLQIVVRDAETGEIVVAFGTQMDAEQVV